MTKALDLIVSVVASNVAEQTFSHPEAWATDQQRASAADNTARAILHDIGMHAGLPIVYKALAALGIASTQSDLISRIHSAREAQSAESANL